MIKYNYKGAADLWDKYYSIACDPWTFNDIEKQKERRAFMYVLTRRKGIKIYIDFLYELIDHARPIETAKSRCFDFEYERQLEDLIYKIKTFQGVIS